MTENKKKSGESEPSVVFSFRTPLSLAKKWNEKIFRARCNKSEFFRLAVEQNKTEVIASSPHAARAVFLLSKASNNLNQITHRAHLAHMDGTISAQTFQSILGQLQILNNLMLEQVREAGK